MYSTVLQAAVERIYHGITGLARLRANGHAIGALNWKEQRQRVAEVHMATRNKAEVG